jgi:predicted nucleotidyltransferase
MVDAIVRVLAKDDRVLFAYLYGTMLSEGQGNDIDIAVFSDRHADHYLLSADLKIDLHQKTGHPPDAFDIRIVNEIPEKGDIFAPLYLKNVLEGGQVLVNKTPDVHAGFLERYGWKFRECEGLIQEVLA